MRRRGRSPNRPWATPKLRRRPVGPPYAESCAECHLPSLEGSVEAPALAGPNFLSGPLPVAELMEPTRAMPPGAEGSPSDQAYAAIVAYTLRQNGFPAGDEALVASADVELTAALPTAGGVAFAGDVDRLSHLRRRIGGTAP